MSEQQRKQQEMDITKHGGRKFYDLGLVAGSGDGMVGDQREKSIGLPFIPKRQKLVNYVRENVIGSNLNFIGPFGCRRVLYCDYIASGRSLEFIENYIVQEVLPHYGNTHTTTTVTSLQSTLYRHEARVLIRNAVNASENDAVVFVGHGCTGAVHKLIHSLNLQQPPIVFVSPYEHHSSLLPWREAGAEIVFIAEDKEGRLDLQDLETKLKACRSTSKDTGKCLIGCLSACSNITGILTDVDAVATCLHRYDALACFDYACAGPYCDINMNPIGHRTEGLAYKDAVFISPHKFVGGPSTPGILIAKKHCFRNPIPSFGGGGSVFYVTASTHRYLQEIEMREEGGTPAIVESIRAGLVFQLKEAIGHDFIMEKEFSLTRKLFEHLENCPNILVLGSKTADRLPVLSFLVQHKESQRLLHHNFVCAVMNDLFGIQARGGCACAGPYAQKLLGITQDVASEYERLLLEDQGLDRHHLRRYNEYSEREVLRPGFVRLNLQYFMSDDEVDFVLDVLSVVSRNAWKLLPQYNFNPETGEWRHRTNQVFKDRKWLGSIKYENGYMEYSRKKEKKAEAPSFKVCLEEAEKLFASLALKPGLSKSGQETLLLGERGEQLRWFLLPSEAAEYLSGGTPASCKDFVMPFRPGAAVDSITTNGPLPRNQHICSCSAAQNYSWIKAINGNWTLQSGGGDQSSADGDSSLPLDSVVGDVESTTTTDTCKDRLRRPSASSTNGHSFSSVRTPPSSTDHMATIVDKCIGHEMEKELTNSYAVSYCSSNKTTEQSGNNSNQTLKETKNRVVQTVNGFEPKTATEVPSEVATCCPKVENSRSEPLRPLDLPTGPKQRMASRNTNPLLQFHHPPKNVFGPAVKALEEFDMIKDGDRVLLCLSGGKDSLSMLHTIRQYQCYARSRNLRFEFGAMTVDPQSSAYNPRPLKEYLRGLQVPYFYEEQGIIQQAANLDRCESICSFCSRMKRGRIYACARREGYNVIALGQHLDDLAESFMMSVFHNGLLRTMKANYFVKEGDLRVIRPLVYVREKDLRSFADKAKLPVIPENCPACFEAPKERHRTKQLLAQQEVLFPNLFSSIVSAIKPLLAKDRTGMESTRDVDFGPI